jgi:crossover junction endodeoxyribonuclease RuvC
MNYHVPAAEYSPREIKKAVTGNGTASKQQVQFMVKSQLNLRVISKHFDVSDALAVALCHSFRLMNIRSTSKHIHKSKNKSHRAWSEFIRTHPERIVRNK